MIKCPNCGSSAQIRVHYTTNEDGTKIIKTSVCGCGCTTTATYTLEREVTRTKDGTQIGHR